MKKLVILFVTSFCAWNVLLASSALQNSVDKAARSASKRLELSGVCNIDAPIILTEKHNGLSIVSKDGAIISAERKITNWQKDGVLWKAKLDGVKNLNFLIVNGVRANLASDGEYRNIQAIPDNEDGLARNSVIIKNSDIENLSKEELEQICVEMIVNWQFRRHKIHKITDNKDGSSTLTFKNAYYLENISKNWTIYRFINAKRFLDAEGEFFYDNSCQTLYYYPRKGENVDTAKASYSVLPALVKICGDKAKVENINFCGVKFEYCAANNSYEFLDIQASSTLPAAIQISNASDINFKNCRFANLNGYAIEFSKNVKTAQIRDCVFFELGGGALKLGLPDVLTPHLRERKNLVSGVTFSNNVVYKYGREFKSAVGVLVLDSADNVISDNTICDGYYTGVSCGWTWNPVEIRYAENNKILRNKISKIGQGLLSDMGGIYLLGKQPNTLVAFNEISDVKQRFYTAAGIYCDQSSSDFVVENNWIYNCDVGLSLNIIRTLIIRNNVFEDLKKTALSVYYTNGGDYRQDLLVDTVFERNIFSTFGEFYLILAIAHDKTLPFKIFDKNIYYSKNNAYKFSYAHGFGRGKNVAKFTTTNSFEKWRVDIAFDNHSSIENPMLENGIPQNVELCQKLGIAPFSTNIAGVKGDMKAKFEKLKELK